MASNSRRERRAQWKKDTKGLSHSERKEVWEDKYSKLEPGAVQPQYSRLTLRGLIKKMRKNRENVRKNRSKANAKAKNRR